MEFDLNRASHWLLPAFLIFAGARVCIAGNGGALLELKDQGLVRAQDAGPDPVLIKIENGTYLSGDGSIDLAWVEFDLSKVRGTDVSKASGQGKQKILIRMREKRISLPKTRFSIGDKGIESSQAKRMARAIAAVFMDHQFRVILPRPDSGNRVYLESLRIRDSSGKISLFIEQVKIRAGLLLLEDLRSELAQIDQSLKDPDNTNRGELQARSNELKKELDLLEKSVSPTLDEKGQTPKVKTTDR